MANNIGIITEQNDLGFGFDPINEKDQKTIQENMNKDNKQTQPNEE